MYVCMYVCIWFSKMENYILIRTIGEGSFGKAILVQKKTNGKQYVIKEICISKVFFKKLIGFIGVLNIAKR